MMKHSMGRVVISPKVPLMRQGIRLTFGLWLLAVAPVAALFIARYAKGGGGPGLWFRLCVESIAFLGVMIAIACVPSVRGLVGKLDRTRAFMLGGMFCALLAAQLISQSRITFPFLVWNMYTTLNQNVPVLEFDAAYASGRKSPYPFIMVCPSAYHRPFMSRFDVALPGDEDSADNAPRQKLLGSLQLLVDQFNEISEDDPMISLCLTRATFHAERFGGENWVQRERLVCVGASKP